MRSVAGAFLCSSPSSSSSSPSSFFITRAMATDKGSSTVANVIKDIEIEKVQGPSDAKFVKVGSFWENQTAVVHILRRFGCRLCRHNAVELQKIAPILEANNVRIVAIGIEKLGLEEFQKGGFWDRELYIDNGKKILKALDIKSVGILNSLKMIYDLRDSLKKANKHAGNLKGDGRQLGATFVISQQGATLMDFRQKDFADHPSAQSILDACGIDPSSYDAEELSKESEKVVCNDK